MHLLVGVFLVAQLTATLDPRTIRGFEDYVHRVDVELVARARRAEPLSALQAGVFTNDSAKEVSRGLVHDWTAIAFVPGAKKAGAVAVLEDFAGHSAIYPEVVTGRTERREGNKVFAFHRLRKKNVLEVTLDAKYELEILPTPPNRYASRSVATEIAEVHDAGTRSERRLPPGKDHGFLWRLQTYWTVEETPQGLWMEVRSISLTRDIPTGLGWAVKPIVRDLPRESLEALMEATKKAILARR